MLFTWMSVVIKGFIMKGCEPLASQSPQMNYWLVSPHHRALRSCRPLRRLWSCRSWTQQRLAWWRGAMSRSRMPIHLSCHQWSDTIALIPCSVQQWFSTCDPAVGEILLYGLKRTHGVEKKHEYHWNVCHLCYFGEFISFFDVKYWIMFVPWASSTKREVVTLDLSSHGIHCSVCDLCEGNEHERCIITLSVNSYMIQQTNGRKLIWHGNTEKEVAKAVA